MCAALVGDPEDDITVEARVKPASVEMEFRDGDGVPSTVDVHVTSAGTDVRVGLLQCLITPERLVVIVWHPPYPISRWTVIYDGKFE